MIFCSSFWLKATHHELLSNARTKRTQKLGNKKEFEEALLTEKTEKNVFFENPVKINFLNDHFFRARFDVPPSAPTGEYKIRSFLIKDGNLLAKDLDLLKVEQVGLNAFIFNAAHDYSLLYALICIILALFSGWLVSVLKIRP